MGRQRVGKCASSECDKGNTPLVRGYCYKHYYRFKKYGDPSVFKAIEHHGHKWPVETPEYVAWKNMKQRTQNQNRPDWQNYGARGITVDPQWQKSFLSFYKYVGPKPPNTSLERIDNNKGYVPGNVRWATREDQSNNTRTNVRYTIDGRTLTLTQWVRQKGVVSYGTVRSRLVAGWDIARALATPRIHKSGCSRDRVVL